MESTSRTIKDKILFRVQRSTHNIGLRNLLASVLKTGLPGKREVMGLDSMRVSKSESEVLKEVKEQGFADFGIVLSNEQINAIIPKLKQFKSYDTAKKDNPEANLDDPEANAQLAHYRRDDLASIPEIVDANDKKILNAVSRYLGVVPTISNINCWWSFSKRSAAKEAQLFHRDLDDFKFVKLFFYLTDVDSEAGPHIYVKSSHKVNKRIDLRRFSDLEVKQDFGDVNVVSFERPKGTSFLVDTYGIHKGLLPKSTNRLLLQIQYSYFPLYVKSYTPTRTAPVPMNQLDEYANRLLFKS